MNTQNFFKKIQPLIVWGISDLYFILAITVTILFGVLSPDLHQKLNLSNAELGFLGFGFFLSFGITQVLTGNLMDSWGPRITLTLSAFVASIGLFLLSTAEGFYQALMAQIIMGSGFSTSYVGAAYLAAMWFKEKLFSLIAGLTLMSGNIVSATLIATLALTGKASINFRDIMFALSFVSLLMAFLLFLFVRKAPESHQKKSSKSNFWEDLSILLHIPQFWFGTIYFSATIGVYLSFSSLWNVPESLAYGHDLKTATMLSATLRFGTALGSFLSGLIASYLGKCAATLKLYSTGALIAGIVLMVGPILPTPVVFFVFALLGFFFGGAALGFPLVAEYIPSTLKGTAFGLMAALGYLLCALLEYVTGLILSNQAYPNIEAFKIALAPLLLVLAVACASTFWLKSMKNV